MSDIQDPLCAEANDLYTVMLQVHLEDYDRKFSRDIKANLEPAIIRTGKYTPVGYVARFCCEFFVITVDPTFSLGDFDVTQTTYRHLLLVSN